jgi:hypothetical protein
VASEIALPVRLVELKDLKTKAGDPVRVLCERRDELFVQEQFALPGERGSLDEPAAPDTPESKRENAKKLLDRSPVLIHSATVLIGADGREVRPAFHCDEAHAVPGSFPWRLMSLGDKLRVITAILDESGFGGAADSKFSGEDAEGTTHGVGALEVREGDGDPAAGGAPGS